MRYLSNMEIRDILKANLQLAVHHFRGVSSLASKCDAGSIKYFEQVLAGFQGPKDKNPRSLGPKVAAAVATAMGKQPQWMYEEHRSEWNACGIDPVATVQPKACEPNVAEYKPSPSRREMEIEKINALIRKIDDRGLAIMLDKARDVAGEYPLLKQTPASSQ